MQSNRRHQLAVSSLNATETAAALTQATLKVLYCGVQLWFELYRPPSPREAELLEEVLASWFMMGRLGAYNAQNLQVLPAL